LCFFLSVLGRAGRRAARAPPTPPLSPSLQVTHHLLQCILQHAHLKAGAPGAGAVPVSAAAGGAPAQPAFGAPAAAAAGGGGDPNAVGADGLTGVQRDVKAAVSALGAGPAGAAVDGVCAHLAPSRAAPAVRDAVAFLLEEGHLYSTTDEFHVKVA
jgi:hypothetical protein